LTDFGLSKEEVSDNTSAMSFCGSIAYLAPEMIKRKGHGKSVDWYLLGVLVYEMLTGIPPFYSKNRKSMI
jgi:serine/threonine protein kinase